MDQRLLLLMQYIFGGLGPSAQLVLLAQRKRAAHTDQWLATTAAEDSIPWTS